MFSGDACRLAVLFLLLIAVSSVSVARDIKRDPNTGLIRVLYIGAPFSAKTPYSYFRTDPLLSTTPISGNLFGLPNALVKKAMRLYMPRTKADMVSKYDVIGIDDSTYTSFPPNTLTWMRDGCKDQGLGIFMGGGSETFGGAHGFPSWGDTVLVDVMPVGITPQAGGYVRNVLLRPEDPFVSRTPWDDYENHNTFGGYNVVTLRIGANEISELVPLGGGRRDPGWTWWDIGEGRFFASPTGFRGPIGSPNIVTSAGLSFIHWKHYGDFVCNMVYFVAGLELPEDIQLLYKARQRFRDIDIQRKLTLGMVEFADRFGADMIKVDRKLGESDEILKEAKSYFVDMELEKSIGQADRALKTLKDAFDLALKAKNVAMVWTFVTEWLVVTGTSLVCGVGIWTLMVKRRLYREVGTTSARGIDEKP